MYEETLILLRDLIQLLDDDAEDNSFVVSSSISNIISSQKDPLVNHAILEELLFHHDKSWEIPRITISALTYLFRNDSFDKTFNTKWSSELMKYSREHIYYIVGAILSKNRGSLDVLIKEKTIDNVCSYFLVTSIDNFRLPKRTNTYYDLRDGYILLLISLYGDDVIDFIIDNMGRTPLNFSTASGGYENVEEMKGRFDEDLIETFEFVYDTIKLRTS